MGVAGLKMKKPQQMLRLEMIDVFGKHLMVSVYAA
jgi:hypothetical protein